MIQQQLACKKKMRQISRLQSRRATFCECDIFCTIQRQVSRAIASSNMALRAETGSLSLSLSRPLTKNRSFSNNFRADQIRFPISFIENSAALDPARPLLQAKNKKDRLDSTDAIQVQVVHSNAGFYGMSGLQGKVDFCFNGGRSQTYCKRTPGMRKNY
jgi:phosphatidylserine sn-1 acylhydrolase